MAGTGRIAHVARFLVALSQHAGAVARRIVNGRQPLDACSEIVRQRVVGGKHVSEIRVTPFGRNLDRVEHGGLRRYLDVGHVCVPDGFACAEISPRHAALDDVGDDIELRILLVERLAVGIRTRRIELSERATEGHQIRIANILLTDEQHQMLPPGSADPLQVLGCDARGDVDAANLGAERGTARHDFEGRLTSRTDGRSLLVYDDGADYSGCTSRYTSTLDGSPSGFNRTAVDRLRFGAGRAPSLPGKPPGSWVLLSACPGSPIRAPAAPRSRPPSRQVARRAYRVRAGRATAAE